MQIAEKSRTIKKASAWRMTKKESNTRITKDENVLLDVKKSFIIPCSFNNKSSCHEIHTVTEKRKSMEKKKLVLRGEVALLFAIFINSMGVLLMLQSGSGISAISSVPYAFSEVFPTLTLGTWTYIFQGLLVITLMVLKKRFVPERSGRDFAEAIFESEDHIRCDMSASDRLSDLFCTWEDHGTWHRYSDRSIYHGKRCCDRRKSDR